MTTSVNQSKSLYRGLIYIRIEDHGPDITSNLSSLDEAQALSTAVQAFTLIGVGTGTSRSSLSEGNSLFGPLPVSTLLVNSLIYPFLIDDQTSKDERIRKSGRSCAFMILVSRQIAKYDSLREYLVKQLDNFVSQKKGSFKENDLKELDERIRNHNSFRNDGESNLAETVSLSGSDGELKQLVKKQSSKITLLEQLVNMDTFSKALMTMYESNPEGGSLDQLAKMAGMSRIMIGWNLRKYIKAGILKMENNQIEFLT